MPDAAGEKLCFVVGPIGSEGTEIRDHADWLLDGIIRPVLADFPEFQLKRADQDSRPGLIDVHMINDLLNAELVIADLSLLNPNAFYEIGIRHMTEKPIIHMQLVGEQIPFDVSLYRAIKFSRARFKDVEKAKEDLRRFVSAVLAPDYKSENPVSNAVGRLKLERNATPEMRLLMEEIAQLKSEMNTMRDILVPHSSTEDLVRALRMNNAAGSGQGFISSYAPPQSGFVISGYAPPQSGFVISAPPSRGSVSPRALLIAA